MSYAVAKQLYEQKRDEHINCSYHRRTLMNDEHIYLHQMYVEAAIEYKCTFVFEDNVNREELSDNIEMLEGVMMIPNLGDVYDRENAWWTTIDAIKQMNFITEPKYFCDKFDKSVGLIDPFNFDIKNIVNKCNDEIEILKQHNDSIKDIHGAEMFLKQTDDKEIDNYGTVDVKFCCHVSKQTLSHAFMVCHILRLKNP